MKDYVEQQGSIFYLIEVRLLSQIWVLKKRFSEFDSMHKRLLADLEFRVADNLPDLPPKRLLFNRDVDFIKERKKNLNKYLKFMILIFEVIESPIVQRFLEIDTRFDPNYDFGSIDLEIDTMRRSESDCSSLFLEMDKFTKTRMKSLLRNETGPYSASGVSYPHVNCL